MSAERRVAVWRSAMLPASETFVRHQGDALTRWRPVYVGAARVESALARDTDVIAYPGSGFLPLRLTGRSPRLRRVLAGTGAALVHAHFGGDGWLVSATAARLGLPLVVTVHGHDVTRQPLAPGPKGLRHRRNLRTVLGRAAVVLAVSEPVRERAIHWGADPARVRVHHTGVPVPAAVPVVAKRWDVAFVGRFVEKKGVGDLLAALALAAPVRPRAVLIGDGPLAQQMRARAALLGVDATFLGVRPPGEVAAHLAASRVLAAPSRTARDGDTEGLPTTVLEAGALGLPVVATRHSGIPEAVLDGTTGLLGAEGDPAALARNLIRVLADDHLRERLGRAARQRVRDRFDLATQTRRLEDLYDGLTVSAAAGSPRRSTAPGRSPR